MLVRIFLLLYNGLFSLICRRYFKNLTSSKTKGTLYLKRHSAQLLIIQKYSYQKLTKQFRNQN